MAAGLAGTLGAAPAPAQPAPDAEAYRTLVGRYCVSCHNNRTRTAGLALDTIAEGALSDHTEVWERGRPEAARPTDAAGRRPPAR